MTQISNSITNVLINSFFPELSLDPSEASKYFSYDASFLYNKKEYFGQHAIYQVLKTIPPFSYKIENYSTQNFPQLPTLISIFLNGYFISFGNSEQKKFLATFYVKIKNNNHSALITSFSFDIQ